MTHAPTLFDTPRHSPKVRRDARQTSREAAAVVLPRVGTQRHRVYTAILLGGAMTDEMIAEDTGLSLNSVRPRRLELLEAGLIEKRGTRKTGRGTKATVWAAKETI